jgi:hypothetical protein
VKKENIKLEKKVAGGRKRRTIVDGDIVEVEPPKREPRITVNLSDG